jgi:hypothetical protein
METLSAGETSSALTTQRRLRLGEHSFESTTQALDIIKSLPENKRYQLVSNSTQELLSRMSQSEDDVLQWNEIMDKLSNTGLKGVELANLKEEAAPLTESANRIKGERKTAQRVADRLYTFLEGSTSRAKVFSKYIQQHYPAEGRKFYDAMLKLFRMKSITPRIAICALNHAMLKRNARTRPWSRTSLRISDIITALYQIKKAKGSYVYKDLLETQLVELRYTFSESGILIQGEYRDELFPVYPDEGDLRTGLLADATTATQSTSQEGRSARTPVPEPVRGEGESEPRDPATVDEGGETVGPTSAARKRPAASSQGGQQAKKARPSMTPRPSARPRRIPNCCKMTDEDKARVINWYYEDFKSRLVAIDAALEIKCKDHIGDICKWLDINGAGGRLGGKLAAVRTVVENHHNFHIAWVHPSTRTFFLNKPQIRKYREEHLLWDRFRPVLEAPQIVPSDLPVEVDWKQDYVLDEDALASVAPWLKDKVWWLKDPKVCEMILDEIKMLEFHTRRSLLEEDTGLGNAYFTFAAQLFWADPTTWLLYHRLTPRHPVHFLAYPVPLRYMTSGPFEDTYYEGLEDALGVDQLLNAEILLSGETREVTFFGTVSNASLRKLLDDTGPRNFTSFVENKGFEAAFATYNSGETESRKAGKSLAPKEGQVILYAQGTIVRQSYVGKNILERDRISLCPVIYPANCLSNTSQRIIKQSQASLDRPTITCFAERPFDMVFRGSVRLSGVGALYEMLQGKAGPADHGVIYEINQWKNYEHSSKDRHRYTAWQKLATEQLKIAFNYLKEAEMRLFPGNKSYFRSRELKGKAVIPDDDVEFIIISDDDDDGSDQGEDGGGDGSVQLLSEEAKRKGKGKEVEEEEVEDEESEDASSENASEEDDEA